MHKTDIVDDVRHRQHWVVARFLFSESVDALHSVVARRALVIAHGQTAATCVAAPVMKRQDRWNHHYLSADTSCLSGPPCVSCSPGDRLPPLQPNPSRQIGAQQCKPEIHDHPGVNRAGPWTSHSGEPPKQDAFHHHGDGQQPRRQ